VSRKSKEITSADYDFQMWRARKSDVVGYIYAKSLRVANTSIMHFKCDMNLHVLADIWQVRTKDIYPCFIFGNGIVIFVQFFRQIV